MTRLPTIGRLAVIVAGLAGALLALRAGAAFASNSSCASVLDVKTDPSLPTCGRTP